MVLIQQKFRESLVLSFENGEGQQEQFLGMFEPMMG